MPSEIKFLTIEDVSKMLQVTRVTIYNLQKKGLPFIKIGKTIRFEESDVLDWIRSNKVNINENKE